MSPPNQNQPSPASPPMQPLPRTYAQAVASPPGSPRRTPQTSPKDMRQPMMLPAQSEAVQLVAIQPITSPSPFVQTALPASDEQPLPPWVGQPQLSLSASTRAANTALVNATTSPTWPTPADVANAHAALVRVADAERPVDRRGKKRQRQRSPNSSTSSLTPPSTPVLVGDGNRLAMRPLPRMPTAETRSAVPAELPCVYPQHEYQRANYAPPPLPSHHDMDWVHANNNGHMLPNELYPPFSTTWSADNGTSSQPTSLGGQTTPPSTAPGGRGLHDHAQPRATTMAPARPPLRPLFTTEPLVRRVPEATYTRPIVTPFPLLPPAHIDELPRPRCIPSVRNYDWPVTPRLEPTRVERPPTPFALPPSRQLLPPRPIAGARPLILRDDDYPEVWQPSPLPSLVPKESPAKATALLSPVLNAADYAFTPAPFGGFPRVSFWDKDSLVQGLPPMRVAAIDAPGCNAVLFQVWNVTRLRPADVGVIRSTLTTAIQLGLGAGKFSLVPPELTWPTSDEPSPERPTFTGIHLPEDIAVRLITIGAWSSRAISFFAYSSSRPIPHFLFLLNGYTDDQYEHHRGKAVANAFKSEPSMVHLRPMFAANPKYCNLTEENAVALLLTTASMSMRELGSGYIAALYCEPPTDDAQRWRAWRQVLIKMEYPTPFGGTGKYRQQSPCLGCHGADHLTHQCPYPSLPGWNGPPAGAKNAETAARPAGPQPAFVPAPNAMPPPPVPMPMQNDASLGNGQPGPSRTGNRGGQRRGQRAEKTRSLPYANPY
ncbi:hypothetical protein FKP32DRAFT_1672152 [Trametes sanguinea]|nr:hypothetical protein FKP32DRAFT_1672152 [Trametes sanguinea]